MKKTLSMINKTFWIACTYTAFIAIWLCVSFGAKEFFSHGLHTSFEDLYGRWSLWGGMTVAVAAFLSPLYLRKWIKKELFTSLVSVFISIIFIALAFSAYWITYERFRDFTPERWREYDRQRLIMLDDLRTNHSVIGMTRDEIIKLLGAPDENTENVALEYSYDYGYITVFFEDGVARYIEGTDKFGKHY